QTRLAILRVLCDVDAPLCHYFDGIRVHLSRLIGGAVCPIWITVQGVDEPFGHLRPRCVVRAKEQDLFLRVNLLRTSSNAECGMQFELTGKMVTPFSYHMIFLQKSLCANKDLKKERG
ncbi:MAG: hypothetical protein ACXWEM_00975, partial [Halobacteriota archaeon]